MNTAMVIEALIKIAILIAGLATGAAYLVLLERRMAAWIQDRIGPNRVGIPLTRIRVWGLGQPPADGLKIFFKQDFTPAGVDRVVFTLAPIIILIAAFVAFAVVPFGSVVPINASDGTRPVQLVVAPHVNVGIVFVLAASGIAIYGVLLGGWSSNNKYSFLGGSRASAQLLSYELPMGLAVLGVVTAAGSLDLETIIQQQGANVWYALAQPLGFLIFVVAALAEAARLPFDLPECEQELVGGYHTEYSGMRLLMFLLTEFLHLITASLLIVVLFLGGWHLPWLTGYTDQVGWFGALLRIVVLVVKVLLVVLFFMLVRWSWPRFRYDQLMALAWKVLLPLGMVNFTAIAILDQIQVVWKLESTAWTILFALISWAVCLVTLLVVGLLAPRITDNRPMRPSFGRGHGWLTLESEQYS